jgi:DNA-binding PadR family transcriptional regulator
MTSLFKQRRGDPLKREPEAFRPLPKYGFDILVSLSDRDRHGYAVMQDVEERTAGTVKLNVSTLYATISKLLDQGWIEELSERPEQDDERRRYYRLTKLGRKAAIAEASRLERALSDARSTGLLPRRR